MIKLTLLLSLQYGESALMLASINGHTEIVKHLVEAKASLDLQSRVSWPSNTYFFSYFSYEKGILARSFCLLLISQFHDSVNKIPHVI